MQNIYEYNMEDDEINPDDPQQMMKYFSKPGNEIEGYKKWMDFLKTPAGMMSMFNQPASYAHVMHGRNDRTLEAARKFLGTKIEQHESDNVIGSPFHDTMVQIGSQCAPMSSDVLSVVAKAVCAHIDAATPKDAAGHVIGAPLPVKEGASDLKNMPVISIASAINPTTNVAQMQVNLEQTTANDMRKLLGKRIETTLDANGAINGMRMPVNIAADLLVQSCRSANEIANAKSYIGGEVSKGLSKPISANLQKAIAAHMESSGNSVAAIPPTPELLSHGCMPKHIIGKQVNVYQSLEAACTGAADYIKSFAIGGLMEDAELEGMKKQISREINAGTGALSGEFGYKPADLKGFSLSVGSGFYGVPLNVYNADNAIGQTRKIADNAIDYEVHPSGHMVLSTQIGDHYVHVPITPGERRARRMHRGQYQEGHHMRVNAGICTNSAGEIFHQTVAHNAECCAIPSKDGKQLTLFF